MSPLLLVGLLVFATLNPSLADVKHVLEGSAHPPDCKCAQAGHHHYQNTDSHYGASFSTSGNYNGGFPGVPSQSGASNNIVPGSVAFWWMDSNSPFKHAYDHFKKCSSKGNCFPPVAPGFEGQPQGGCGPSGCTVTGSIDLKGSSGGGANFGPVDVKKNPFLNGQIQGVAGSGIAGAGFQSSGAGFQASGAGFHGAGAGFQGSLSGSHGSGAGFQASTSGSHGSGAGFHASSSGSHGSGAGFQASTSGSHGAGVTTSVGGGHIDLSGNPFLNQGQAAYSGNGQAVVTGSDGFLGVQPSVPFGKGGSKVQPFPTAYPGSSNSNNNQGSSPFPTAYPSQPGAQPFPSTHPGKNNKFQHCNQPGHVCVAQQLCINGLVKNNGQGTQQRNTVDYCEIGKEVCCRLPEGAGSSYQPGGSTNSYSSYTTSSGSSYSTSGTGSSQFGGSGVVNLQDITAGKSSVPGSSIKFGGGAGLSPGVIQVLSPNENVPNPLVSSAGESGSGVIHTGSSSITNKVVRDTTPNPNSVFSSTIDYSNDKLDQISFGSTIKGPQYLPPVSTPVPSVHTPDLELPHFSTYQPSIPTTSRPFVTKPIIPGSSVVSVFTQKEYPVSSPKPFDISPQPQQPIPSIKKPDQYLPPYQQPSSPKPFVTAYPTKPSTYKPYSPQPSQPISQVTGGYSYPTPTPAFEYPKPSPSVTVNNQYIPPKQPTPSPTTSNNYYVPPKVVTQPPPTYKPYSPQPSQPISQVTGGYSYPTPTPAFEYPKPSPSVTVNNQYIPPKQPTPAPTTSNNYYIPPKVVTQPPPTYKPYNPPTSPPVTPNYNFNNQYVTKKQPPQPTPGYSYPTPTPAFHYPSPSNPPRVTVPPYKPTNNGYLPPRPEPNPDGSNNNNIVIKPTTQGPAYIPPLEPAGGNNVPVISNPSVPHAGCAAALRCVQEQYCTADGFISQTPVVLSRDQEYLRVPTTDCSDVESGIIGKCCRDPNYVDPWPSANLINGFDNGQYREDPNLGQYFPQKQRPVRSETSGNAQNLLSNNAVKTQQVPQQYNIQPVSAAIPEPFNVQAVAETNIDNTCGLRNPNAQPRGPGPIDAAFGEIPWQAMVLRDSNRSLLCGGVIVKPNCVLTAAHCLDGLYTSDILIKGGEWKLGIDEEPLPFQIVKVAAIIRHPGYQPGALVNDLALLMLEEKLRVASNIAPICLPQPNQAPSGQCIATGWGKQILQVHLRGAIMRSITVNLLDSNQCSETLTNRYQQVLQNYAPNTICGYSQNDQCDVDYGSALACTNGNGQYTLAGIYSWDTGCKDEAQIGGYIAPDVEWIESTCSKPLTHLKALDRQFYRRNQ